MNRIVKVNFKPTLFLLILTFFAVSCTKLEKVEGCKVTDIVSGQAIEGVRVIANASSNLKSEQKYLHFETMTDRNGKFNIKGLPGKNYSLTLEKDGYQSKKYISIRISEEGTKICQLEIELYPNLPNSDVEYNIYDPYSKKIIKKIHYQPTKPKNLSILFLYYSYTKGYNIVNSFLKPYLPSKEGHLCGCRALVAAYPALGVCSPAFSYYPHQI